MQTLADLLKEFDMAATDAIPSDLSFALFDQEKGSHRKRCTLCDGEGCDECDKGYEKVTLGDVLKYSPDQERDDHGRWSAGAIADLAYRLSEETKLSPEQEEHRKHLAEDYSKYDLSKWQDRTPDKGWYKHLAALVDSSPPSNQELFRGIQTDHEYHKGESVNIPLSDWTETDWIAKDFGNTVFRIPEFGTRALSASNLTEDAMPHFVTHGNFEVEYVSKPKEGPTMVYLRSTQYKNTLADLIKYSDYQPRDDHGRWTTGPNGEDYTGKGESLAHDRNPQLILKQQIELERVRQELPKAERERVKAGEAVYRRTGMSPDDIETYKRMHGGNAPSPKADEALNNYQAARDRAESLERTADKLERDVDERTRPYYKGEMAPGAHVQLHDGRTGVIAMTASKDSGRIKLKDGTSLQVYRDDLKPHVSMQAAIDSAFNKYFESFNSDVHTSRK